MCSFMQEHWWLTSQKYDQDNLRSEDGWRSALYMRKDAIMALVKKQLKEHQKSHSVVGHSRVTSNSSLGVM